MIILKSSHLAVVAAKDQLFEMILRERDYYRALVLGMRSLPDVETVSAPTAIPAPSGFGFGAHWSDAEWVDYNNWCALQHHMGIYGEPEMYRKLYLEQFGDQSPSDVMREG